MNLLEIGYRRVLRPRGILLLILTGCAGGSGTSSSPSATASDGGRDTWDHAQRGAAAATLGEASSHVQECKALEGRTGSGHVTVTFAASGEAMSAIVDAPAGAAPGDAGGGFPGTETGRCVEMKFMAARVPAFQGQPVKVGKTFSIR
jgi:hypothetical protein